MNANRRLLVQTIERVLRQGFQADAGLIGYIDAVFADPAVGDLERIIGDDAHAERDGLLELIFFPGETIQHIFEEALGDADVTPEDIDGVAEELSRRRLRTVLEFPDGRGCLPLDFSGHTVETFLQRLNLTRRVDKVLLDAVAKHVAPPDRTAARVKLRNARKHLSEKKVRFLAELIEKSGSNDRFLTCLDFMLDLLEDLPDDADVRQALVKRSQAYRHQLQKAAVFEEKLRRHNIETLMMHGERAAHPPKGEILAKIDLIDGIHLSVYGQTTTAPGEIADGHAFALRTAEDFRTLLRRLL